MKDTMYAIMPFLIVGSIFLLISNLPIPNYKEFLSAYVGAFFWQAISLVAGTTFELIGFLAFVGFSYNYSKILNLNVLVSMILSISVLFLMIPVTDGGITLKWFSTEGFFINILVSITAIRLYGYFLTFKMSPKNARRSFRRVN